MDISATGVCCLFFFPLPLAKRSDGIETRQKSGMKAGWPGGESNVKYFM